MMLTAISEIIHRFENISTDWVDVAREEVRTMLGNDAVQVFEWSIL